MIKVKDLAVELSIKLGDPRRDNGDGGLFWANDRIRYIERAYGKLTRTLGMAMRKYKPRFVQPLEPLYVNPNTGDKGKPPYPLEGITYIKEVIVSIKDQEEKIVASVLAPENYNQVKFNLDPINKASKTNIFYTHINDKLYLLPWEDTIIKYEWIYIMASKDIAIGGLTENSELPIDKIYSDMLITFAAIEAMNDLPSPQKVQLYRQELIDQVSVISNYTNLMERREGDIGNG